MALMAASPRPAIRYAFKEEPFGSHLLLLTLFPRNGKGMRVLDVGCGQGYLAGMLADRGFQVTGVERPGAVSGPFPEAVRLIEADLDFGLPALEGPFDFILCADVLEHLRDPAAALAGLSALLAPQGRLMASLPNAVNLYCRLSILAGRFPKHEKGLFDRTHLQFFSWAGWVELLASVGFRIEKTLPTPIPFGLAFPRWRRTLPLRLLEWLALRSARWWKTLFAYQFVVVARCGKTS